MNDLELEAPAAVRDLHELVLQGDRSVHLVGLAHDPEGALRNAGAADADIGPGRQNAARQAPGDEHGESRHARATEGVGIRIPGRPGRTMPAGSSRSLRHHV
jgi:hypothetical protein